MPRTALALPTLCFLLAGCLGGRPDPGPSPESARAQCDSYAAQAIQSSDLTTATTLAAQASQCYADLQRRK